MRHFLVIALLALSLTSVADEGVPGISPEVAAENEASGTEAFRIRVTNTAGGAIDASRDGGGSWVRIGSIVTPATIVNPKGFTASKWAADSSVCATAVNAIHITVAANPETGRGMIFSLTPAGTVTGAAVGHQTATAATDIPGGEGIFGGGLSPTVNSPVAVEREGRLEPLSPDYAPADGDVLVITVRSPARPVSQLIFENTFGGIISLRYADGEEKPIGTAVACAPTTRASSTSRRRHRGWSGASRSFRGDTPRALRCPTWSAPPSGW